MKNYGLPFRAARACSIAIILPGLFIAGCASLADSRDYLAPGALAVHPVQEVTLNDPQQNRDVVMQVTWPEGDGQYPVVVFSHGAFCYPQQYASVTDFWVSQGYIVVLPNHLDSPNGPKIKPADIANMLSSRVRDMSFALDSRAAIEAQLPALAGHIDYSRAAVAGHSFGGMIAMIKVGLHMQTSAGDLLPDYADDRFQAAVVMSGVGQMAPMAQLPQVPYMADSAFDGIARPLIASGGTQDEGNVGSGEIFPWQWRMSPYTLAPAGADDKYALVLEDADHYLGGLICRSNKGGEDDPVAVEVVRAAQAAFLDGYLKQDKRALSWLRSADFAGLSGGRATLEYK